MWLFVKIFSGLKELLVRFILSILNIFKINKEDKKLRIDKDVLFLICIQVSLIGITILFKKNFAIWVSLIFNIILTISIFRYRENYFRFYSLFLTVVATIILFKYIEVNEAETVDYETAKVENISCKTERYRTTDGHVYEIYECKFKFKHANTSYEIVKDFNEIEFYKDGDDTNIRIDK